MCEAALSRLNRGAITGVFSRERKGVIVGMKILLADDDDTFLRSTADLLRREGYECDCVSDAVAGIAKLQNNEYDLLIADIKMPGNADLELIRRVPKIAEETSVILVTGYPSQRTAIEAVRLSVVDYLVKPFELEELLEIIRTLGKTKNALQSVLIAKDA